MIEVIQSREDNSVIGERQSIFTKLNKWVTDRKWIVGARLSFVLHIRPEQYTLLERAFYTIEPD